MPNAYADLLQPGRIGNLELRNRIMLAPMGTSFGGTDGRCGERAHAYFEARAKGGVGLLSTGVCAVAFPSGTSEPHQLGMAGNEALGIAGDTFIPGLSELTRRVHAYGAKIAVQLAHQSRIAARDVAEGRELWVPSPIPNYDSDIMGALTKEELAALVGNLGTNKRRVRVMDSADIEQMTEWFVHAAVRAQEAGFDGVEIHAAHGYIFSSFLSPHYNTRDDSWGGSLENRARLLLDTIKAVKQRTGGDFPVWVRLDGEEMHTPDGITLDHAVATARLAATAGADAIHMSAYTQLVNGSAFTEAPIPQREEAYIGYAQAVRKAVDVPVIAAGRIEPEAASRSIGAGEYDFVAMGRKLLADPELPNKLIAGRPEAIRPCIYCYVCVSQIFINRSVKCAVNPETGHEYEAAFDPAAQSRHILVVGGGPAGMEAARVAALRGHRVTLVERSGRLGGTLFFAGLAYPENGRLLDYLIKQMDSPRIKVQLETEVTAELVDTLHPDKIIVATGARRAAPAIEGAEQRHVWSGDELRRLLTGDGADAIVRNKLGVAERAMFRAGGMIGATNSRDALQGLSKLWMPLGKHVAIVGGGLVGMELAEFLLARGRDVTVLEPGGKPGRELSIVRRWRVLEAVRAHGTLHARARVTSIGKDTVVWEDKEGQTHTLAANSVVLALGAEADERVARSLGNCGIEVQAIGDCAQLGYIDGAMHSGYRAGLDA